MTPVVVIKASKGGSSIGNAQFVLFGFKLLVETPSKKERFNFPSVHAALNSSTILVNAGSFLFCPCTNSAIVFPETFVT